MNLLLERIVGEWNRFLWGPGMLVFYIGVGLMLTWRTRFFQVRYFGKSLRLVLRGMTPKKKKGKNGISAFQAVATALAGTMGVGNIAGAAAAIAAGGAGAIFWMWVSAFFGMMTKCAEAILAVQYRDEEGSSRCGGPMYYISRGLGMKWMAVLYAVLCLAACFGVGSLTPAGEVAGVLEGLGMPGGWSGVIMAGLCAAVICGGMKRVGKVSEWVIPILSLLYILFAAAAILMRLPALPGVVRRIFEEAFCLRAAGGGVLGMGMIRAMRIGLARGVYTNEAGMGSSAIAHAVSEEKEPVRQGMLGIFEVFLDTFVITALTALVVLTAEEGMGASALTGGGAVMAAEAFSVSFGKAGESFVAVSMFCFALPSMFGWASYGEKSLEYLLKKETVRKKGRGIFRLLFCAAVMVGAVANTRLVWGIADVFNGLMAIPNLTALVFLSGKVVKAVKRYEKAGTGAAVRSR